MHCKRLNVDTWVIAMSEINVNLLDGFITMDKVRYKVPKPQAKPPKESTPGVARGRRASARESILKYAIRNGIPIDDAILDRVCNALYDARKSYYYNEPSGSTAKDGPFGQEQPVDKPKIKTGDSNNLTKGKLNIIKSATTTSPMHEADEEPKPEQKPELLEQALKPPEQKSEQQKPEQKPESLGQALKPTEQKPEQKPMPKMLTSNTSKNLRLRMLMA